ncbi:hypothetical protein [Compostibacter hankyongensis]|uniref:Uncharacterized protein n=1 Tax=Compostibacter hankyongensis TaxID=1007089 RepID=A0ABP8G8I1_9BACT
MEHHYCIFGLERTDKRSPVSTESALHLIEFEKIFPERELAEEALKYILNNEPDYAQFNRFDEYIIQKVYTP